MVEGTLMKKRWMILAFWFGLMICGKANAQLAGRECPFGKAHYNDLICLIPELSQTGQSSQLSGFNSTIAQVLGQLPLAVPNSGTVLGIGSTGISEVLNDNLGSVLTERGNTLGKNRLFMGFTFQRFVFKTVDGTNLSNLPVFGLDPAANTLNYSLQNLHANIDQYTAFIAFGLTDRIDLSATLPFNRISLSGTRSNFSSWDATSGAFSGGTLSTLYVPGSASGAGDLVVNIKGSLLSDEGRSRLAAGMETRFPTGDAYNFLGTGAYGVKPYIVFSRFQGRVTPHVNLGYQWNDFSVLRIDPCYTTNSTYCNNTSSTGTSIPTLRLPASLDYSAGVDIGLLTRKRKLSVVADLVGQRYFNAPRVLAPVPINSITGGPFKCSTVPPAGQQCSGDTVQVARGPYSVDNLSAGLKFNPMRSLIISANALIRLDSGGLRPARVVPLVGISYRYGR